MIILDGKKLSERILEKIKKETAEKKLKLRLAVILVGKDAVSEVFVRQKEKACKKIRIDFKLFKFPAKISQAKLKKEIKKIVKDKKNSGAIIQLSLPKKFSTQEILNLIPPAKDIDILSETNLGKFYTGNLPILPPVVGAISYLFKKYKISLKGKKVVLVGAGKLVGLPMAIWLSRQKATISIVNEFTKNISSFTKKADILISGVGKPNLINSSMVKKGAVVIDAGTSYKNGELVGDVDFKNVSKKASYITPVPGGVGLLTVALLLSNLIKLNSK
jgi:methylenetetrahydrofolate dehydrogenase (NADP+)/methenyltetrahydrofolate cyclohydrolase